MGRLSQAMALANMTSSDRRKFASGKGSDVYFTKITITNELLKAIPPAKEKGYDFISVDVETATGNKESICQIAIVGCKDGQLDTLYSSVIQPPNNEYWQSNSAIHGIYPEDTENAITFAQAWDDISALFSNKVVAHNASFDVSRIEATLNHFGIQMPSIEIVCTYELTGQKLKDACRDYGITMLQHHDALSDATCAAMLYLELGKKTKASKKVGSNRSAPISQKTSEEDSKTGSRDFFGSKKIASELLIPVADAKDNFFKGKRLVFTGDLNSMSRQEAAELVRSLGADINTSISKKTDVVIMGGNPGPSKLKKIEEIKQAGYPIQVLQEEEFLTRAQT